MNIQPVAADAHALMTSDCLVNDDFVATASISWKNDSCLAAGSDDHNAEKSLAARLIFLHAMAMKKTKAPITINCAMSSEDVMGT